MPFAKQQPPNIKHDGGIRPNVCPPTFAPPPPVYTKILAGTRLTLYSFSHCTKIGGCSLSPMRWFIRGDVDPGVGNPGLGGITLRGLLIPLKGQCLTKFIVYQADGF